MPLEEGLDGALGPGEHPERAVNGVRLADWTRQLVEGDTPPATVACEGSECCQDPVCEECLATGGQAGAHCRFCTKWPPAYAGCE